MGLSWGEWRLGNDPGNHFSRERAEPRGAAVFGSVTIKTPRTDRGVGAKRPPHGGGPGAAHAEHGHYRGPTLATLS